MEINKETVTAWLDSLNRPDARDWLADKCGVARRTLDSWLSNRDFPKWAQLTVARLMRESAISPDGKILSSFTTEEFEVIEKARHAVGDPPRPQFYHDAIIAYADDIIAAEAKIKPIRSEAEIEEGKRVAEPSGEYGASPKKPRKKAR